MQRGDAAATCSGSVAPSTRVLLLFLFVPFTVTASERPGVVTSVFWNSAGVRAGTRSIKL